MSSNFVDSFISKHKNFVEKYNLIDVAAAVLQKERIWFYCLLREDDFTVVKSNIKDKFKKNSR